MVHIEMPRKRTRWYVIGALILFCCVTVYLPILLSIRPDPVLEWGSMSRDLHVYVLPDNHTAIHVPTTGHCASDSPPFLLVVVCSAIPNHKLRQTIRSTWANYSGVAKPKLSSPNPYGEEKVQVVFLLGHSNNETVEEVVSREAARYGDIIQENFLDTYNNLTLKSVMLLKWVDSNCKGASFVMKADDDTFVNIFQLVAYLRRKHNGEKQLLLGCLICGAIPVKDRTSKWFAPSALFSGRVYPNYLSGTGYVMSADTISDLYQIALDTPFFNLEDVFITGICAKKLGLKPRDYEGFTYQQRRLDACLFRRVITGHRVTEADLKSIWKGITSPTLQCATPKDASLRDYAPRHCT